MDEIDSDIAVQSSKSVDEIDPDTVPGAEHLQYL